MGEGQDPTRFGTREEQWAALLELVERGEQGLDRLSDQELEDLGKLYRAATTHLALVRAGGGSTGQRERLNTLVARAHALIYAGTAPASESTARTVMVALLQVPPAVRRAWRYHLVAALLMFLGGLYGYVGAGGDADWALELQLQPGDERTPYATRDELLASLRAGRDGDLHEKALFAVFLMQNNTRVALLSFFAGLLGGLPTALLLLFNGAVVGAYTHTFHARDLAFEWWAWLLPHGVTELLAIVLLGGGGLLMGRALLAPGELSRRARLRELRPDALRHLLLAFPMLFLAGLIESFVRQSQLGDPGRYLFAAATAVVWAVWLGLARPPERWIRRLAVAPTLTERVVPLPLDEELLGIRPA